MHVHQREQDISISKAIPSDVGMEDVLVLDKNALIDIISKSGAFYTIRQRKNSLMWYGKPLHIQFIKLGEIIDYQIPLNEKRANRASDVDLLA